LRRRDNLYAFAFFGSLAGVWLLLLVVTDIPGWQAFLAGIPLGRPQSAEDIGHACAYLASDLAMNITGEALNVSGGQQMH